MGKKTVPVIATNIETGEKTRYDSIVEAARSVGARGCNISRACVTDQPYRGFLFQREDDWIIERSK